MGKTLDFYRRALMNTARDKQFRAHVFSELRDQARMYLPARLVTPRRDYVYCRYLSDKSKGRWLPPLALKYRISAYGLLFDEVGRVLLTTSTSMDFGWNLPGGGVNRDETLEQGLQREFEEETGLRVNVGPPVMTKDNFCIFPTGRPIHAMLLFYLVEIEGGQLLENGNGFDTTKVTYVDIDQLPDNRLAEADFIREAVRRARELRRLEKLRASV
ncbi:MAG TPA: NUDIX hydrolase [Chloroflexia bacterium]|nr:NUDIX hydrolase [Chloroflexia bacterium]